MDHLSTSCGTIAHGDPEHGQSRVEDDDIAGRSRGEARVKTLIRSAKLITSQGEFVCVVRDVSRSGIGIRLFHRLPDDPQMAIQMPSGREYEVGLVRTSGNQAGFQFIEKVDVEALIGECSHYPKRALRFGICFPIQINAGGEGCEGVIENISQQGARFACAGLFAINQTVQLAGTEDAKGLISVDAKVRWRRDNCYGVVFDTTLSMDELAKLCVRFQSPMLA